MDILPHLLSIPSAVPCEGSWGSPGSVGGGVCPGWRVERSRARLQEPDTPLPAPPGLWLPALQALFRETHLLLQFQLRSSNTCQMFSSRHASPLTSRPMLQTTQGTVPLTAPWAWTHPPPKHTLFSITPNWVKWHYWLCCQSTNSKNFPDPYCSLTSHTSKST